MRASISAAIVAAALTVGCGLEPEPSDPPPVELVEICGEQGPLQVLRFEPWRAVRLAWHWASFGERRLISVLYDDTNVATTALWSVGPCGEAPRRLVSGRFNIWTLPPYDLPFICDAGKISVVDPTGERAPRLVFETGTSCLVARTEAGLVHIRPDELGSETGALILHPWPADVWTDEVSSVVLLDRVKTYFASPGLSEWDTVQDDEDGVFVITGDDELVRVTLPAGSVEIIATGVRSFQLSWEPDDSKDGYARAHLLWQRIELGNGDPDDPEGEILLFNRTTNELRSLGQGGLHRKRGALNWIEHGLLPLHLRVGDELVLRLFRFDSLDSLDFVDVDPSLDPQYLLADDRQLLVRLPEGPPWGILDVQTGELWIPPQPMGISYWWEQRAATALLADGQLFWLTGKSPPKLIARRAKQRQDFLPDGRLLTVLALDRDGVGDLIVVDPETLEERLVDRRVSNFSILRTEGDELVVSYSVFDGDRSGLWLARLQPRD